MKKKTTFVLDEGIIGQAREIVEKGTFKSMNAFVETAIKDELVSINKERIKAAIKDAAKDPLFLADIREIEKDFEHVDFEEAEK